MLTDRTYGCWVKTIHLKYLKERRALPKSTVFCAVSKQKLFEHFLFPEITVIGVVYLDMFEEFFILILE
jgi:hypothetical protein